MTRPMTDKKILLFVTSLHKKPPELAKLKRSAKKVSMAFRIIIGFVLLLYCDPANGQTYRLDSLKTRLSHSHGEEEVSCALAIAKEFTFHFIHSDSALRYASLAFHKATAVNNRSGAAEALILKGDVLGRLLGYPEEMKRHMKRAISSLEGADRPDLMSLAYNKLAVAYAITNKNDSALMLASVSRSFAEASDSQLAKAWSLATTGFIECKGGKYWSAFEHLFEAQQNGKETGDSTLISFSLAFMGRSFNRVGDPSKALEYYHQAMRYATPFILLWPHMEDMAYAHLQLGEYDSALYYQQKYRATINLVTTDSVIRKRFRPMTWGYAIDVMLARQQYDEVLAETLPRLSILRDRRDFIRLMESLLNIAKSYSAKGMYHQSLRHSHELLHIASSSRNQEFAKQANQVISEAFSHLGQTDSSYFYFKRYAALNDSIKLVQFAERADLYRSVMEAENKMQLMEINKANLTRQLQNRELLLAGLVAIVLFCGLAMRNVLLKRRNEILKHERSQSELRQKATELEMQALRAQMNPHFIFNCLSAIDNLIQTNQSDRATSYLARFAKLIRNVLDSSKNNVVTFQRDFEMLRLYLELERFRCNDKFDYRLNADERLLYGDYKVPPLIIQPFVENAIHHGLLNKQDGKRVLDISAQIDEEHILYHITDNGVGRKRAAAIRAMNGVDRQQYGIDITKSRIVLHNKHSCIDDVKIMDLESDGGPIGTKAIIRVNGFEV